MTANTDVSLSLDPGDYQALDTGFTGQTMPTLTAREASSGREEVISFDNRGILILISGYTCIQRQTSAVRQAQTLFDAVRDSVPVRVVILSSDEEAAIRYKVLLLRKPVRPTFEIWYSPGSSALTETVLSEQLYSAFLVQNQTIESVFHASDHSGIIRAVSDLQL